MTWFEQALAASSGSIRGPSAGAQPMRAQPHQSRGTVAFGDDLDQLASTVSEPGQAAAENLVHMMKETPMADVGKFLDKAYEGKDFGDLVDAPVSALQGVSDGDAEHLKAAFGITTIRELATNKFVLWAQAINVLGK